MDASAPTINGSQVTSNPHFEPRDWAEHTTQDGKKYWYNQKSKLSQWEDPRKFVGTADPRNTAAIAKQRTAAAQQAALQQQQLRQQQHVARPAALQQAASALQQAASAFPTTQNGAARRSSRR